MNRSSELGDRALDGLARPVRLLAVHASLPAAVSAELLRHIRDNFMLGDRPGETLPVTIESESAIARLLLSPLFSEVGDDLYEMQVPIRARLLRELEAIDGGLRLIEVAVLLERFVQERSNWTDELKLAQRISARVANNPTQIEGWLDARIADGGGEGMPKRWFAAMRWRVEKQQQALSAAPRIEPDALGELVEELASVIAAEFSDREVLDAFLLSQSSREVAFAARSEQSIHRAALAAVNSARTDGRLFELVSAVARHSDRARQRLALSRSGHPVLRALNGQLPDFVPLLSLLGLAAEADSIISKWRRGGPLAGLVAPVGVSAEGVFNLDLIEDGPHVLVGGTTGSGKSELLKSFVAGLAAGLDVRALNFLLIDGVGTAVFDECALLPHTIGLVTGLDSQLSERVLLALNSELRRREQMLRLADNAYSITDYHRGQFTEPLPHLVIVMDEFAYLVGESPEFVSSLVAVAQKGRSLGVHLVLATQRPSVVVTDAILANANARIAFRVQEPADSIDLIGTSDAADIERSIAGRAYARLSLDAVVAFQSAVITCVSSESSGIATQSAPVRYGYSEPESGQSDSSVSRQTDLARLIGAIVSANEIEGFAPPRVLWLPPLPEVISLSDLLGKSTNGRELVATVGLVDDVSRQRQYPSGWELAKGNLALIGTSASGTTLAISDIALALAYACGPDEMELAIFDSGEGELRSLERLPHTSAVVSWRGREHQMRLMRYVVKELDDRIRGISSSARRMVIFVNDIVALREQLNDREGAELFVRFLRVVAEGPEVDISLVLSSESMDVLTGPMSVPQKWLFRLHGPDEYRSVGLSQRSIPVAVYGRAVILETKLQVQVAQLLPTMDELVDDVASTWPGAVSVAKAALDLSSPRILISYRRADDPSFAGRLYDRLTNVFGADRVFIDIESAGLGQNFSETLDAILRRVTVVLLVIGEKWLDVYGSKNIEGPEEPIDWVRLEIEGALARNIRIIPILVGGVAMPNASELPYSLSELTRRNAFSISHRTFPEDIVLLVDALTGD